MGVGKKKARGPIAKAIKNGQGMAAGLAKAQQDYAAGVASAGDAWLIGTYEFEKEFVPKVLQYVSSIANSVKDPYARMRAVLKYESKVAAEYDRIKADQRRQKEIAAFGSASTYNFSTPVAVSGFYNTTSKSKVLTI